MVTAGLVRWPQAIEAGHRYAAACKLHARCGAGGAESDNENVVPFCGGVHDDNYTIGFAAGVVS
jgi:hypothetical protein